MLDERDHILVVEDGDEDFDLLRYAFAHSGVKNPLQQCKHAKEALALFRDEPPMDRGTRGAKTTAVKLPSLILLDLNLPDIDGRELLTLLRRTQAARAIPILIFSTSNNPHDVRTCYANGANGYLVKPIGLEALKKTASAFFAFWCQAVELPQ